MIILSDPANNWVFSRAKSGVFLTGGYIRDLLLGHISRDKDYVLKNSVEKISRETAKNSSGNLLMI